ncbi:hypothetical protein KC950_01735 [Candidatus Saccharibacteria bacterium]|nr:hypothetical protein [Candidatus Saccharibacteria bacterium]
MKDIIDQKINAILTYFYKDLYRDVYYDEICKDIKHNKILPTKDEKLIDAVLVNWCLSYYLISILKYYEEGDRQAVTKAISDFTGIKQEIILHQNKLALKYLKEGTFGPYKYFWYIFNKIGDNEIPLNKDPFVSPLFTTHAVNLIEAGSEGLEALKKT